MNECASGQLKHLSAAESPAYDEYSMNPVGRLPVYSSTRVLVLVVSLVLYPLPAVEPWNSMRQNTIRLTQKESGLDSRVAAQ